MTAEDQIGYLQSKIASLEAKLTSLESRGEDPITEGRLHTTPQPAVDPKGRKIWEAEWRGDYKVMMAYVPDNALIIDGENIEVDADDKEGDEVTLSDGSWYLHAYKNKTTGNWEAELDQEPTGTREDKEAKYNIHICDINEDGYIEKQYVVGSIVIGGAGSKFVGDDEEEASEEIDSSDGVIHLQGFKGEADGERTGNSGLEFLTVGAREGENGEKIPPKAIIDIKGRATASGCGNTENWGCHSLKKDGNLLGHFLGCRDIDIVKEGGGGGGGDTVVGSDYIEVADEQDTTDPTKTNKAVKAKVSTPANQGAANNPNAVLTHNTDQFVRSKKTFIGVGQDNSQKKVVIDGPNGKVEVQNAAGNRIIKLDAADIPNECGQGGAATIQVRKLTVTHPRTKDGKTADVYHVIGCADIEVQEGDAIDTITSGAPTQSGGFTLTPVTIRLKDGTNLPAFNISAKNGSGEKGDKGDDGASVTGATAGTPVVEGNTTTTPITFTLSDGTTVGPVNVVSTNGVDASGSDYIEVGDGTSGTTKGQVKAKVPADGTMGLVTTDTKQTITGEKTFSKVIYTYSANGVDFATHTGHNFRLRATGATPSGCAFLLDNNASGATTIWNAKDDGSLTIGNNVANSLLCGSTPTVTASDTTKSKVVATCGWVNDKYKVTELVKGDNITITPDATNPKKLTIAAQQPTIPNIEVDTTAVTSGKAVGGLTVDATNKHKIIASAIDIPSAQIQSDWNQTNSSAKDFIKNKPTIPAEGVTKIIGSGAVHVSPSSGTGEVTVSSTVRNLVAGSGISLTASGNDITITNTAQGGGETTEGFTGKAPWLDGFKYDKTTHKLMYRFGSIRYENGLAVEYTPGGDDDFVDVPGGDAVEETV